MPLDPNKFTRKTQEALGAAQAAGRDAGNTEIAPEHLLRALLDQPEGIVTGVLERIGVDLVDAVVFDDQGHWWSLHELTSGMTAWGRRYQTGTSSGRTVVP